MATKNTKIGLPGSERAALAGAVRVGPADPNEIIDVTIVVRRGSKTSGRFPRIEELGRTPLAERRHLTGEECAAAGGALTEDLARVRAFARANGLRATSAGIPRRAEAVTGTVRA